MSVARPAAGSWSGSDASISKSSWRSARRKKLRRARTRSRTRLLEPGATPTAGRVERAVDAVAGVDQVEAAAREVVAVVLDHELERGAAATTLQRLQHGDPPVVERADGDDGLGGDRVVGAALRDDPHREAW